ncbi:hypothetical protein J3R82DRAFT_6803 [Butyriboletus roseoflavus]|nr:hypothetical protein J3R82DRAFT_6803 [Butyriboletus roseoflavus]
MTPIFRIRRTSRAEVWRNHRWSKPVGESMTSNASSKLTRDSFPALALGYTWGTFITFLVRAGHSHRTPELSHYHYVRSYASYLNINSNDENTATAYKTCMKRIEKRINQAGQEQEQGWRLVKPIGRNAYRATWWTKDFDAVGTYSAPSMLSIPGLE